MSGPVAERSVLAEGADGAVDDARIALADGAVADAQPIDHARAERFDEDVCPLRERQQRVAASWAFEIEHDALLAAIEIAEEHRARSVGEADVARRIALARRLDL